MSESQEIAPLSAEQRAWRWKILFSTYIAYSGFYLSRKVFSICKTSIAADLSHWLNVSEKTSLNLTAQIWAAFLLAYMIGQFVNSFVGRKWGPRVLLLGGLGVSLVINTIFGFANSYWTFMTFMFFNGLVQACGWPGCVGGIAEWLRKHERGTVMGIWSTNYLVGSIIVKSLGGFLLAAYGWRYAFFGCTVGAFVIWWVVFFWQRDKPEDVGLEPIVDKKDVESRAVNASNDDKITFRQYTAILLNPVVPLMGLSYFFLKFLRYSLDSWTPTFLNLLGLDVGQSAYYSMIFDFVGLPGAILAGLALDRWFRGRWATLCFFMGIGMVVGYILIIMVGANPIAFAFCCGLVGFMLYGPDTLLCGAAAVQVAGEKNALAVAGLINGIGSIGPVIQELVIGQFMKGENGIREANYLGLGMSVLFVVMMLIVAWQVAAAQKKYKSLGESERH